MTARYAAMMNAKSNQSGYCASSAAACTSAHIVNILDTAIVAVSIIVIHLVSLLVLQV